MRRLPRGVKGLLVLLFAVAVAGCGDPVPETMGEAKDMTAHALEEAAAARKTGDADRAEAAARRARTAADAARDMMSLAEATPEDNALYQQVAAATRETTLLAELTEEDVRLADTVSSWKAGLYRQSRGAVLKAAFAGLAAAARQARNENLSSLPEPVREAALNAAELARLLTDRADLPDGTPDWKGIAADMDALGSNPSPQLGLILAVGFAFSGSNRLALYEIEAIDPQMLKTPEHRTLRPYLRAVILSGSGFPRLSVEQMRRAAEAEGEDAEKAGPELLATIHLVLAYHYASKNEPRKADLEVVRAMKVWPDSPVSVFLTGEKLAADGQYEEAAESLEKQVKGTKYAWLGNRLARRAREVRDKKGEAKPLFTDTTFLCEVALFCIADWVGEEAARTFDGFVGTTRSLAKKITGLLT